jgi:hypothetical protein
VNTVKSHLRRSLALLREHFSQDSSPQARPLVTNE